MLKVVELKAIALATTAMKEPEVNFAQEAHWSDQRP